MSLKKIQDDLWEEYGYDIYFRASEINPLIEKYSVDWKDYEQPFDDEDEVIEVIEDNGLEDYAEPCFIKGKWLIKYDGLHAAQYIDDQQVIELWDYDSPIWVMKGSLLGENLYGDGIIVNCYKIIVKIKYEEEEEIELVELEEY
nr:MAG: hypothetical protein [uncultured archaeon]